MYGRSATGGRLQSTVCENSSSSSGSPSAEEDGGLSFVSGEPFSEATDKAFEARLMALIESVDTMVLGANTYAQSQDYWPYTNEQGEYGEKLNNLTKYVASSKLDEAPGASSRPQP